MPYRASSKYGTSLLPAWLLSLWDFSLWSYAKYGLRIRLAQSKKNSFCVLGRLGGPTEPRENRRLTAILAADVVGYSRLMGRDETGTLATVKADRRQLFGPRAAQYHGRTVKLMGDGTLMEFASVVDAVRFAVEVQCAIRDRSAAITEDRQVLYRIGVNIGDIVADGEDIYGDGVNIAARLQAIADPGGICLSRNAYNQIKGKLDLDVENLGEKEVKNIAEPLSVYRVVLDGKAAALVTPLVETPVKPGRIRPWHGAAAVVAASAARRRHLVAVRSRPFARRRRLRRRCRTSHRSRCCPSRI